MFDSPEGAAGREGSAADAEAAAALVGGVELSPAILSYAPPGLPAPPPARAQFFLGPPGSGAPFHAHRDAFNALIFGRKRWFLLPPDRSLYSTTPVATWLASAAALPEGALQCVQEAGDVVFVPRGWAHAVLNLRTSVGVAVEASGAEE